MPKLFCFRFLSRLLPIGLFWIASAVAAADTVQVTDAWARATVPGQKVAGAYMQIVSAVDARLVGVASPVAGSAEVHWMTMEGGTMRMRAIDALELPAGKVVDLAPGGYHIMLFRLKQPLIAGERVALTLELETVAGGKLQVPISAEIRARAVD